jgi:hypothetical protein
MKPKGKKPPQARGQTQWNEEEVAAAIRKHQGRIYHAAKELGVTSQCIYNYRKRWPALTAVIKEERGKFLDKAESMLNLAVEKGEAWAVIFTLKTQGKRRGYSERHEFRHGGDKNAPPIKTEQKSKLTIEDLKLPLETRKTLLAAVRKAREERANAAQN